MKHSAPPAKIILLIIVGLALFSSACVTATRTSPNPVQLQFAASNPARVNAININTAASPELEALPGIGKALAERIIAHRERYGPFRRTEHLLMVRGISERNFRAMLPMITVE